MVTLRDFVRRHPGSIASVLAASDQPDTGGFSSHAESSYPRPHAKQWYRHLVRHQQPVLTDGNAHKHTDLNPGNTVFESTVQCFWRPARS